jgi:hypothetical protein
MVRGPLPLPPLDEDNGWFIDHLAHDYSVLQTYRPENLHFIKRISAVQDADWEISRSAIDVNGDPVVFHVIATDEDMVKPWANMFRIRNMIEGVETKILAGPITNTNASRGGDKIKVSGKDWLAYFDRRQIPYTSADPLASRFGPTVDINNPPTGLSYAVTGRDVGLIVKDIIEFVLSKSNSMAITNTLSTIGYTINFSLGMADTSTLLSIIDGISEYFPGFDYLISYDREFTLWTPTRYGNPDTTADDGPGGANICLAIGDDYDTPPVSLDYTGSGPSATHLRGTGAGTNRQSQISKSLGASDIQGAFFRLDGSVDFGDQAKTQAVVDMRTRKEFIYGAQEVHDIVMEFDPLSISDFWNTVRPGLALWVTENLQLHEIDSAQRIMEMDCTVSNNGDERVTFGLNQIYNTSTHYGVDQG